MFKKLLIANRGEIACRVIKTAKKMGITTVAIYSDADKNSLHVEMADEAIHIGPPPANQSYIVIDKVMAAIKESGAQAVHPGYGFLSENSKFAEALAAEGVAFVGPPVGAIEKMGDKITSKKIAQDANVSTVPGYMGLIEDADEAVKISNEVGYPVMIKASAGGGGKGMRIAWNDDEAREGFQSSKNEAANSFGDDRIFIEKFITQPRHIEIQVLADQNGNIVHLGERECSIQRRHQKLLEEAPSPMMSDEQRNHYGDLSAKAAASFNYAGAGTIEYLLDEDGSLFFLEMNTRLQVEHPVSESITGIDLMQQQIIIAAGGSLPSTQDEVTFKGHAIELRVNAEDTNDDFRPTPGQLTSFTINGDGIRFDTHLQAGDSVPPFYDSLLGKVIAHADTREQCIKMLVAAIGEADIEGLPTTLGLQRDILLSDDFKNARCDTLWLDSFLSGNK